MKLIKIIEATFAIIFGLIGWLVFFYQTHLETPKLEGKLLFAWHGVTKFTDGNNPSGTSYCIYPWITNSGNRPIHILDYELEINFGQGYEKIPRAYLLDNVKDWNFDKIHIPNFLDKLIYKKDGLVSHGKALHGFVMFIIPDSSYNIKTTISYRLICIDAFENKHIIEQKSKDINYYLEFYQLSGTRVDF